MESFYATINSYVDGIIKLIKSFFALLGIDADLGKLFKKDEDTTGGEG